MIRRIELENVAIDIIRKNIKNIYLRIYYESGKIKISAPKKMDISSIRNFAFSKLDWIKKHREEFKRKAPKKYLTGESHYFNGIKYFLKIIEYNSINKVILKENEIELYIKPNTTIEKRQRILDEWYRLELKSVVPDIIKKWENKIGVTSNEFGIKKMKTKWGSCNVNAKRIWVNLELSKKKRECLEYVIVHELTHLLERKHNKKFISFMDKFMPEWKVYKEGLNNL